MKKRILIFFIVILILIGIPLYSFIKWSVQPNRKMNVFVLDKTVPDLTYEKHRSLFWVLNHNNFVKSDDKSYSFTDDYYGFFPLKPVKTKKYQIKRVRLIEIDSLANEYDVLYYADTYGVYYMDWYRGMKRTNRSSLIYGGMNQNDYLLLKEMIDQKKLVIAEYNTLGSPTSALIRKKVEDLLDFQWTGWQGKYFRSLKPGNNNELPQWIINTYEKQYGKEWTFNKSGIILLNHNQRLVVLENETHLSSEVPLIHTGKSFAESYNVADNVHFPNWFDIITTNDKNEIISEFELSVNAKGKELLDKYHIPEKFPAVIKYDKDYKFYYFSGDFSNNHITSSSAYFKGVEKLDFVFFSDRMYSSSKFYWTYYLPLMSKVLDNYYDLQN